MELEELKEFYEIAQCQSLTKAAQKIHISQPSLSRNLRALEEELGTPLFDRIGRNIVLNDAGRHVLWRVADLLDSADSIKREMDKFIHDETLLLDVYCPVPMGDVEAVVIGFKKKYPDVRLRVASWPGNDAIKSVRPHITFFASPIVHKERNYLLLGEEDICLAVAKDNPLAKRKSVKLADLSEESFVRVLPSSLYELTSSMFLEAGFVPHVVIEDQDFNRILSYVSSDFGVCLAPHITWFGRWKKHVVRLPISDVKRKRYLYLKWPENTVMNWATLRFREYVIEYFNTVHGFTCSMNSSSTAAAVN